MSQANDDKSVIVSGGVITLAHARTDFPADGFGNSMLFDSKILRETQTSSFHK